MKVARIGFMVLGIVFFMFVIAPYASAQPAIAGLWYKGTASLKGYEIGSQTNIIGKDSGKGKIYVNIEYFADTTSYTVTTCLEDMNTDDIWYLSSTSISTDDVYGVLAEGETMIWDFFRKSSMVFDAGGDGPYELYPMFTAKIKSSSVSFKSFACAGYRYSSGPFPFGLGACTVSFKSTDPLKVPTGPTRCIRP